MITSLTVQNFRGLKSIHLPNLSKVNIVVGPNASGKTALLEAIWLGCRGSPQLAMAMWQRRIQSNFVPGGSAGFKSIWSGFFYNLDLHRSISIRFSDSNLGEIELRITADDSTSTLVLHSGGQMPSTQLSNDGPGIGSLSFERIKGTLPTKPEISKAYIGAQGQFMADAPMPIGAASAMFSAFNPISEADTVEWLSQLSLANREEEAYRLLSLEFPNITSLGILSPSGINGIYVAYKGNEAKIPIGLVSAGIQKILGLILASLNYNNGVLLIDELENGLFYRRYPALWSLLYKLAVAQSNQIFVSSHSLECLRAVLSIAESEPGDFSLIRLEDGPEGPTTKKFSGKQLSAALEQGLDFRGEEILR